MNPQINSELSSEGARARLEAALNEMVLRSNLQVENLTQAQLVDVIKQMIECGDIVRHVRPGHGQAVVYVPYAELEKVKAQREEEAAQHAHWRAFAEAILDRAKEHTADGNMSEEDQETLELAVEMGVGNVRHVEYDREKHGDIEASPGDMIYYWGEEK